MLRNNQEVSAVVLQSSLTAGPKQNNSVSETVHSSAIMVPQHPSPLEGDKATKLDSKKSGTNGVEDTTVRASLPRNSKKSHKFLSDNSHKARETVPNAFGKRNKNKQY